MALQSSRTAELEKMTTSQGITKGARMELEKSSFATCCRIRAGRAI
jgi:hypothetical protein